MDERELIERARKLIRRYDNMKIVGSRGEWSGNSRQGFAFNPVRGGGGGGGGGPIIQTGACCLDGDCFETTQVACELAGGTYMGNGTDCDTLLENCPVVTSGACCVAENCSIETPENCLNIGGVYQGDNTDCDPNPCLDMPPCLGCGFPAFDGSGRLFLTMTERIIRTAHQDALPPTIDGCDLALDVTTTTTISTVDCSQTVICSGTYSYVNITHPDLEFSNCNWESDGFGGCHLVFVSGAGGIGCGANCTEECLSCTPITESATEQSCSCDSISEFQETHLTHTIILSDECEP